jgi:hypothetical protein
MRERKIKLLNNKYIIAYHVKINKGAKVLSSSSISLSRDRSIVPSRLSFSVFGERLSRNSCNVVVFPYNFALLRYFSKAKLYD